MTIVFMTTLSWKPGALLVRRVLCFQRVLFGCVCGGRSVLVYLGRGHTVELLFFSRGPLRVTARSPVFIFAFAGLPPRVLSSTAQHWHPRSVSASSFPLNSTSRSRVSSFNGALWFLSRCEVLTGLVGFRSLRV